MLTLWDVVKKIRVGRASPPASSTSSGGRASSPVLQRSRSRPPSPAQDRYDAVARLMLTTYGIKVRRWRSSMSGIAWQLAYADGSTSRLIESPRPKGPVSASIFLHEIGHHVIGFNRFKPRCLEEYHAWMWSLAAMEKHGLNITPSVTYRVHASLYYAVAKARRRGLKAVPQELLPYTQRPAKPARSTDH